MHRIGFAGIGRRWASIGLGLLMAVVALPADAKAETFCSVSGRPPVGEPTAERYDLSTPLPAVIVVDEPGGGPLHLGGVTFAPLDPADVGEPGLLCVAVDDDISPAVGFSVCQHPADAPPVCVSSSLYPGHRFSGITASTSVPVQRDLATTVVVHTAHVCIGFIGFLIPFPCGAGVATSGTVTFQELEP